MIEESVHFYSGDLLLEGVLTYKEDLEGGHKVLVCSPHPNLGGDMDNNVIKTLSHMLAENGFITLRFNYRGVGGSQSHFKDFAEGFSFWETTFGDSGNIEDPLKDTKAALEFLKSSAAVDSSKVFIVGYSFGALVGMKAGMNDDSVRALAGIATPFGAHSFSFLAACKKPKLFICSDNDFATSIEDTRAAVSQLSDPIELIVKADVSHFYIGIEKELVQDVIRFLQPYL